MRVATSAAGRLISRILAHAGAVLLVVWAACASDAGAQEVHFVTVGNNFFSPQVLSIEVGDTVQWTNASGFHNVFSCNAGQLGCEGETSAETFTSGPPANPLWIYSYTFTQPGSNPYVCQAHAAFMTGRIDVEGPPAGPPPVGDGSNGAPMTVNKLDPSGTMLEIAWDTGGCPGAVDHQILFGTRSDLPGSLGGVYQLEGGQCSVGTTSPVTWNPPEPSEPHGLLWWVVVTTNGATREGSWGEDSLGGERSGPGGGGASGVCGIAGKDLSNPCQP